MTRAVLRPRSLVAFVALLTIVALFPMVVAFACTAHAVFSLSPASALAGETVAVTNTGGFQSPTDPVSKVVLRWDSSTGPILWTGSPNSDGTLPPVTFQVPAVPPSNGYTVIAYPYDANGALMMNGNSPPSPIHSNAAFTVNAPPAPPAPQSSAPAAQPQAPAAAPAPAQASNGAAEPQAEPPAAAAPVAPAPASAGSGIVGNAGNQASGGQQTPVSHSPAPPTKPTAGSGVGIAIVFAVAALAVTGAALVLVRIRRRRAGPRPALGQPLTKDEVPPDDHFSAAA